MAEDGVDLNQTPEQIDRTEMDRLVEKTVEKFKSIEKEDSGYPYQIMTAAHETIMADQQNPLDRLTKLLKQMTVPTPYGVYSGDVVGLQHDWDQFYIDFAVGILDKETGNRHPELVKIEKERLDKDTEEWQRSKSKQ